LISVQERRDREGRERECATKERGRERKKEIRKEKEGRRGKEREARRGRQGEGGRESARKHTSSSPASAVTGPALPIPPACAIVCRQT
jgi:hypothetical protein